MKAIIQRTIAAAVACTLTASFARAGDDHPEWKAENLVKPKMCAMCHKKDDVGNQVGAWEKGPHAKAFEVLGSDKAKEVAAKAGVDNPQTSGKCLQCHATAYGFTEEKVTDEVAVEEAIDCQTCHGPGKEYKAKTKHATNPEEAAEKYGFVPKPTEAAVCSRCHNDRNPNYNPERYTRKDGTKVDFDFEQALEKIKHPRPAK